MIKVAPTVLALALLCALCTFENAQAQNEDLWQDITEEEYLQELNRLEGYVASSDDAAASARTALTQTLGLLAQAQSEFDEATDLFAEVEMNPVQSDTPAPPNTPDSLDEAWRAVASTWIRLQELTETRDRPFVQLFSHARQSGFALRPCLSL